MIRNSLQWNIKMREDFIRRAWFRRVWTLQEVVLSRKATLLCGDSEMDWETFCMVWKERYEFMTQRLRPEIREARVDHIEPTSLAFLGLMHCFDIQQQVRGPNGEKTMTLPLSEIMIRSWWRDASEKALHDRVYALLGLVNVDKYPSLRRPDYSQSLSEFFVAVTKLAMKVDQTPALLNIAGLSPNDSDPGPVFHEEPVRPSWVADWTKRGEENIWLMASLGSDDTEARIHAANERVGRFSTSPSGWNAEFEGDRLLIHVHIVGYLPDDFGLRGKLTVKRLSWDEGGLRWKNTSRMRDHTSLDIPASRLPYDGKTAKHGDIVCAFEGIRSLFLVRPMFKFMWASLYGLEGLKEDVSHRGLKLNCKLIGPVQVDGLELTRNPLLLWNGSGSYWDIILN